jgi:ferredoxin
MDITNTLSRGNEALAVRVNQQRCQGHARCTAIAPELFAFDQFGYARAIGDGTVSSELNTKARLAEANCPEVAIEILKSGEVSA